MKILIKINTNNIYRCTLIVRYDLYVYRQVLLNVKNEIPSVKSYRLLRVKSEVAAMMHSVAMNVRIAYRYQFEIICSNLFNIFV